MSTILISSLTVNIVNAQGEIIYIRADGTVDPSTASIVRTGDLYTFTADIFDHIIVETNDITIDGNNYTLQGSGEGYGFEIDGVDNVTVQNTNIHNFTTAIYISSSSSNTVFRNSFKDNGGFMGSVVMVTPVGDCMYNTFLENKFTNNYGSCLLLFGYQGNVSGNLITNNDANGVNLQASQNSVSGNTIANNTGAGVVLYGYDNVIFENTIANNTYAVNISAEPGNTFFLNNFVNNTNLLYEFGQQLIATWTNGTHGNYWDDYDGIDGNGDGIGDTPFVIDENNQDTLPLVEKVDVVSIPEISSWTLILAVVVALGAFLTLYNRKSVNKSVTKTSI
ncbi:MAG: right-handed parallel beta-helix repeat-containing protein [Candidatus Bathyarchaeota archaeon]|nr:right-handed parallel beta-helix repeat-containing protein [Candidatus Bathyarchaeota archaeon]